VSSLRKALAIVAPIVFVACDPVGFEMNVAELFGVTEEVVEETNPRANHRVCFEGYVRSSEDDRPISGATVGLVGDHTVSTRSQASGYYAIHCAPHQVGGGAYLRARKEGWSVQDIRSLRYSIDEPGRYDFILEPQ
jgi:hypothetical protein